MKGIYLIKYGVKGIKAIDDWAEMSFYKKTISKDFSVRDYNVKGLYGMNGSGKSGIMTSLKILKGILQDDHYLNNPLVQKHLDELVNKRLNELAFDVEYLCDFSQRLHLYNYKIVLGKDQLGRYAILEEQLTVRNPASHTEAFTVVFKVERGEIVSLSADEKQRVSLIEDTRNLLSEASLTAVYWLKKTASGKKHISDRSWMPHLLSLFLFSQSLFVYLDSEDDHTSYVFSDLFNHAETVRNLDDFESLVEYKVRLEEMQPSFLTAHTMKIPKEKYHLFEKRVRQLARFLQIFKHDLKGIEIEKREAETALSCSLIMTYEDYHINAEFESTGIKKLIRLFAYFQKMVEGNIVFIDELDSNLHDVYLCALLEYMMDYGEGQLCFTTHNIGPMDVLKKNRKSIDFLSVDHRIYSWKTSGNYSPSKLYRHGMIDGSPFNVDSVDFIGVLSGEED